MSAAEGLRQICTIVDQPLVLVNSAFEVVETNQAFCEAVSVAAAEIIGLSVFGLPDGCWNGPELRQLLVEKNIPPNQVASTPDIEWTLGPIGCRTVRVSVYRAGEDAVEKGEQLLLAIRERTDSRKRLAKHADMAKLLYRVTSLASTNDSPQQALEFCVDAVCELTGWPIGHVYFTPEDEKDPLKNTDLWSCPADWDIAPLRRETENVSFEKGVRLPGKVWQSGKICWIEAISDCSDWLRQRSLELLGIKAAIGFPILAGGRVRAVLEFFNTRVTPQSSDIVMFCNHVSEPVGGVIERKETTQRLHEAKRAAERASLAKSQFLANISHELRTPMTAVLGMLQISLQEELPPSIREYLHTAQDSSHALLSLLNEILDYAGLESGQLTIVAEPFSLRELLVQTVAPHANLAHSQGLQWTLDIRPEVPDNLVGDSVRLRQVIDHLLDNAVKFTERGSVEMKVALDRQESAERVTLAFTVSDTGPGLPPEEQQEMFERFTQMDSSFTRRHGGAGLGLAICRALVDRMGGQLTLQGELEKGCTFQAAVPFSIDAAKTGRTNEPASDPSAADKRKSKAPRRLSVLLAEDTPANQKVIGSILRKRGHDVTIAANGRDALEHVAKTRFDAILMDLQLPVMDGYQATASIQELERHSGNHTPIIALTAHSTDRDRDACLRAGMDAYLAKPIDVGELVTIVESTAVAGDARLRDGSLSQSLNSGESSYDEPKASTIDLAATMKRLGDDKELFRQFIDVFNEDAPRLLQELNSAIVKGDCATAVRAAHSLRGLAANFSATSVVKLASRIEDSAKKNDLSEADPTSQRLSDAVADLTTDLDSYREL